MPRLIRHLILCALVFLCVGRSSTCQGQLLAIAPASAPASPLVKRMTPELLWNLSRIGEAVVSKDGSTVAFTVGRYSIEENARTTALHLMDLKSGNDTTIIEGWDSIASIQWHGTNGNLFRRLRWRREKIDPA